MTIPGKLAVVWFVVTFVAVAADPAMLWRSNAAGVACFWPTLAATCLLLGAAKLAGSGWSAAEDLAWVFFLGGWWSSRAAVGVWVPMPSWVGEVGFLSAFVVRGGKVLREWWSSGNVRLRCRASSTVGFLVVSLAVLHVIGDYGMAAAMLPAAVISWFVVWTVGLYEHERKA